MDNKVAQRWEDEEGNDDKKIYCTYTFKHTRRYSVSILKTNKAVNDIVYNDQTVPIIWENCETDGNIKGFHIPQQDPTFTETHVGQTNQQYLSQLPTIAPPPTILVPADASQHKSLLDEDFILVSDGSVQHSGLHAYVLATTDERILKGHGRATGHLYTMHSFRAKAFGMFAGLYHTYIFLTKLYKDLDE